MSWTRGQSSRFNQSPFIDPLKEETNQSPLNSSGNSHNAQQYQRRDNNSRSTQPVQQQRQQPQQYGRDVAATFTKEGLQTFSTIFSTAVEAAIAKSLPELVERAVERKMQEVVQQALFELNSFTTEFLSQIVQNTQTAIEKRLNELIDAEISKHNQLENAEVVQHNEEQEVEQGLQEAEQDVQEEDALQEAEQEQEAEQPDVEEEPQDVVTAPEHDEAVLAHSQEPSENVLQETYVPELLPAEPEPEVPIQESHKSSMPRNRSQRRLEMELEKVIAFLKETGRPVTTDELRSLVKDVDWGSNISVKMKNLLLKSHGQIERVSKGVYQLRQEPDFEL